MTLTKAQLDAAIERLYAAARTQLGDVPGASWEAAKRVGNNNFTLALQELGVDVGGSPDAAESASKGQARGSSK